jgi:serine/threonine protein kinase
MKPFSEICHVCGTVNSMSNARCLTCGQPLSVPAHGNVLTPALPIFSPPNKLLKHRYRVLQIIGKGGMGTVYIGEDTHLGNRLVAVKEMSQHNLSPLERRAAARNFKQEAHLLASLQHPHLPSIYDHFEEDQRWYLVMSFVKGQTLANYLDVKNGKVPVKEVLEIGIALCNVLNYLHSHQPPIIFRDLKPSNIMRTQDGHIYLIDFGVARFFKPGQTKDTASYGTSGYAPPEQYGTTQTTPRSDIYSLGATLYNLLSGYEPANTPFHFPPIQQFLPMLPTAFVSLITQMLDLDEKERPQNVEVVKQELQKIFDSINSGPAIVTSTSPTSQIFAPIKKVKWTLAVLFAAVSISFFIIACLMLVNSNATNPNSPYGVVNTFCNAMNSQSPDFQSAYNQLSHSYQSKHTLIDFQKYFQVTVQCVVASRPDANNRAEIGLSMMCPHPPPRDGGPPPQNGQPPQDGQPQDGRPPLDKNTANVTLVKDSNSWKIDTIYMVGYLCGSPIGQP